MITKNGTEFIVAQDSENKEAGSSDRTDRFWLKLDKNGNYTQEEEIFVLKPDQLGKTEGSQQTPEEDTNKLGQKDQNNNPKDDFHKHSRPKASIKTDKVKPSTRKK